MKVNLCQKCENIQSSKKQQIDEKKNCTQNPIKQADCDAVLCQALYNKAMVNMQNAKEQPQTTKEIAKLLNTIFEGKGMSVSRQFGNNFHIGRPLEGFQGLHYDDVRAKSFRDEDGFVTEIYTVDNNTKEVNVYNADGTLKKNFNKDEMGALKEYKYNPNDIHAYLRHGKQSHFDSEEKLNDYINTLDKIFKDDTKVWQTQKPMTLYRALQIDLTEQDKDQLSTDGKIYTDKSFVSTTTDYNVACRFRSKNNPILEIEVPKGTKYIDMDALFNIDRQHWKENEFLLPRESKFLITGYDPFTNVIQAKYIGNK